MWESNSALPKPKVKLVAKHFFSGSSACKLDEKARFVLPQEMRYGLVEHGELEFCLALGLGGCLTIYKKSDIEAIVQKFEKKAHLPKFQKFFTLFFSTLHHTTCDKVGRVTIPSILKNATGIKNDVVVCGVMNKIEIWPKDVYDKQLKDLMAGNDPDMNLATLAQQAFALLGDDEEEGEES